MLILGFETSCDDTGVSVIEKRGSRLRLVSQMRFSQIKTHAGYGGVIPEVAAREHAVTIVPTLLAALKKARTTLQRIDLIAVTRGPGLAPALSVGVDTARILSRIEKIPLAGINHIEGHIASVWPIAGVMGALQTPPKFPAVALVVSGGHTELQLIKKFGHYTLLGKTRDDAAGEAFDKVAALLGLPYPGGPRISELGVMGKRDAFAFPRPMLFGDNLEFSFAGLKTSVRYLLEKKRMTKKLAQDVSASFEQAVIDVLVQKTTLAVTKYHAQSAWVVGGVSANRYLRSSLTKKLARQRVSVYCAPHSLTQDNATMIAMAAALDGTRGSLTAWRNMSADPNWELNY